MRTTKLTVILSAIMLFLLAEVSLGQVNGKNAGIGVMIGEPTGITYKNWINQKNAFDLGAAWSFGRYDAIQLHADYLWHSYSLFNQANIENGSLPFYVGVGGRVIFAETEAVIGARIPLGVNYLFEEAPIGLFFEVAPIVDLIPITEFNVNGGIGVRYYF